MTVTVCYIPSGADRESELGAEDFPSWVSKPTRGPAVVLYSDVLDQSSVYPDDGTLTSSAWTDDPLYAADAKETTILQAVVDIQALAVTMSSQISQGQADIATLAAGTNDNATLAAILLRTIQGVLSLTQGLVDTATATQLIDPT